jgi:hypothetical protein
VNSAHAACQAAVAAGDREGYRALQERIYEAYVVHVPMAVSHRARNDPGYRRAYVGYMAAAAVARAFDPAAQELDAEMKQRVMSLRYTGDMMAPMVAPDSLWPMADTLEKQIEADRALYRSAGLGQLDPDHAPDWQAGLVGILPGLARDGPSRHRGATSGAGRADQRIRAGTG